MIRGEIWITFPRNEHLNSPLPPHLHLLVTNWENFLDKTSYDWSHLLLDVLIVLKVHSSTLWGWFFFLASAHEKNCMSSIHLLSSSPIAVTMCMSLCGRKWGNTNHYSRSYQLALFLPLQSFCLPILEVWSPCLSLRLHSFSSCPQNKEPVWEFEERIRSEDWVSSKSSRLQTQKETSFGEGSASRICSSLFPWANSSWSKQQGCR